MAALGKRPITGAQIEKIASELRSKADALSNVVAVMKKKKLPHTEAMGKSLVEKQAYLRIDNFIRSCKRGIGEV